MRLGPEVRALGLSASLAASVQSQRRGPRLPGQQLLSRPRRRRARSFLWAVGRWWAGTAPSPPASAGLSSSGTASTSTARGGVTPTSRTGFENVSASSRLRAPAAAAPPRACPRLPLAGPWVGVPGGRGPPGRKAAALPVQLPPLVPCRVPSILEDSSSRRVFTPPRPVVNALRLVRDLGVRL